MHCHSHRHRLERAKATHWTAFFSVDRFLVNKITMKTNTHAHTRINEKEMHTNKICTDKQPTTSLRLEVERGGEDNITLDLLRAWKRVVVRENEMSDDRIYLREISLRVRDCRWPWPRNTFVGVVLPNGGCIARSILHETSRPTGRRCFFRTAAIRLPS